MSYAPAERTDLSALHLEDRHSPLGLSGADVVAMWRTILLTRRLDQKIWALNRMGKAPFAVSCQGHEGAQVGSAWALREGQDVVCPYYRDTGVMIALGMTAREILEAVFAREADPNSGGRQMPNHWGSSRLRIITGSSPIATHIPHAAGIALGARMRGEDTVVVCYFGDGAASKGDFHEAMNFAGIHNLPLVAVCENNGYAISVPLAKESAVENIAEHAHQYRCMGMIVDGNDPLDVYAAMRGAVSRARKGEGPSLIECKTYRYLSHTSDDDDRTYRTPQEVEAWRKKDPFQRLKQYLIEQRLLTEAAEAELESEVTAEIEEALKGAEASPAPVPPAAFQKVFARPLRPVAGVPVEYAESQAGVAAPAAGTGDIPADAPVRTFIDAVRETIRVAMAADDRVFVLGEDVGNRGGVFKATDGLITEFGEGRVVDMPLAESAIVGVAIGAALHGLRPLAEIQFADFIHPAFDQMVSEAARIHYRSNGDFSVPMVVRAPYGGGVHGALYHSQSVESLFAHVPGLKVVIPSTPADLKGLLLESLDDPDPVLFLEHKKMYRSVKGPVPEGAGWRVPLGVAEVARPGTDATIVTYGLQRHLAVEAANRLADEGAGEVEVLDLRTISPLDRDAIVASACRTGRVLVVSEDNHSFSVAAEVAAVVAEGAFYDLDAPVMRLATADVPAMPYAPALEGAVLITADRIAEAARRLLGA
ncbi:MAG TPA: dehydrogenase E1 component subunit alpha/beta [Acidimicrobiia bacterium]|nr:dehydrogenase E1 component subunit alpha/beta [Acidimicrobiia bacterium]